VQLFLIVGASGFIGNKLYNHFKSKGLDVKGTYYSKTFKGAEKDGIYLDFNDSDFSNILQLKGLTHIFLCHGMTGIDECKINRDISYKINVTNTTELLKNFTYSNVIPIYLSTSMVYRGTKKNFAESDTPAPSTEYGKQKVEVENYITKEFNKYIILRLTKVYGVEKDDQTLFTSWLDSLIEHKTIYSADDILISPIFVMDVVHALDGLVFGKYYGIFNLGGQETLTRYECSLKLAKFFNLDSSFIQRCSIRDFNFVEPRLRYSALNSSKVIAATGIKLTSLEDSFKLIKKLRNKRGLEIG